MFAYNIIFVLLVTLAIIENKNLMRMRWVPISFSFVLVLLFSGLRGDVGHDTSNYLEIYENISQHNLDIEKGFYYLLELLKYLNLNFNWVLFVTALISLFFYFYSLYRFLGFGMIIFAFMLIFCDLFLYFNISGVRQGIAMSIVMLSGYYAFNKRIFSFIFCVFISVFFHKTAVLGLLLYPILNFRFNYNVKNIFIVILIAALCSFITIKILSESYLLSGVKGASMYLSSSYNQVSISAYMIGILRRGYPLILAIIFFNNIKEDRLTLSVLNVYFFGFILYLFAYPYYQDISVRLSSYFTVFESILVIRLLYNIKRRLNYRLTLLFVLLLVYIKILTYSLLPSYQYVFFNGFI